MVEFPAGTVEVVRIEPDINSDSTMRIDLDHMDMLAFVSRVIGPSAPGQSETLTSHRDRADLEVVELVQNHLRGSSEFVLSRHRVAAVVPPVVENDVI